MGVNFIKNIKFWLLQKVEKSHNKIAKFEVENFEHLCINILRRKFLTFVSKVINNGPHRYLYKIGANIYSNLAFAPFLCKKV